MLIAVLKGLAAVTAGGCHPILNEAIGNDSTAPWYKLLTTAVCQFRSPAL